VGYTNAGKSTLFNLLTDSEVYAADQLFATLDPTLRSVELPHIGKIILADTVGFIRHLPHDLVAAFKSTLSETRDADLQLHVIDFSDERVQDNIESVRSVLEQIEADEVPQLRVYNKIDRLEKVKPGIVYNEHGKPEAVYISAARNVGIEFLYKAIAELLGNDLVEIVVKLPGTEGGLRNRLYQMGAVNGETYSQTGEMILSVKHQRVELAQLNSRSNGALEKYCVKPKNFTFKEPEF
jgi:GTP-binding protein HflX